MDKIVPANMLEKAAQTFDGPKGTSYKGLSPQSVAETAALLDLPGYQVESTALANGIWPQRYVRNTSSFSAAEQISLLEAKVMIVGLGGLGGLVSTLLARVGVGRLVLVDFDVFDPTNLNRQTLSNVSVLGETKAGVARRQISDINPSVVVETYESPFGDNPESLALLNNITVCADCLDNVKTRLELARACRTAQVPLVSASIGGFCGNLTVFWPLGEGPEKLYGDTEYATCDESKGCEVAAGTPGPTAAALASLQAMEVCKVIAKPGLALRNAVALLDFSTFDMQVINF